MIMRFFSKVTCAILRKWVAVHNADDSQFKKALEEAKIKTTINQMLTPKPELVHFPKSKSQPKSQPQPISKHRNIYDPVEKPW